MMTGNAMAAWLSDAPAQAATARRMEQFGRRFRELPALVELERQLAATPGEEEQILESARHFLARSEVAEECLDLLIAGARSDPFFRPPLRGVTSGVHAGLLLVDRPDLTVFLSVATADALAAKRTFRAGATSIAFPGYRSVYRFLKTGGALISFWEAPAIEPGFTAGSSGRCRLVERRRLEEGEIFELDGARQSFVVDHAVSDMVYLQAMTPVGAAPLMVEYDSATLEFAGASTTDEASSRLQMMLSLLRIMDRTDAAPVFREMLQSRHFYARWHAMREFLALDAELALPHLQAMARDDPHPEVRSAASETLAAFFDPQATASSQEELPCPA